jgi:outer membrane lipoprotein LolB
LRTLLRTGALLACALLAGCASAPPAPPAARDQVGDFALEARFALRVSLPDRSPESSGGRLDWEHSQGNDRILIANPLGVGIADIDSGPALSRLRTGDGQLRESSDPDALIEAVTGQRLPVRQLSGWLLGRGEQAQIERDASGRPARLSEAGWQIDYAYPDEAPGALPERLTLRRDNTLELRLRIETWKTAP